MTPIGWHILAVPMCGQTKSPWGTLSYRADFFLTVFFTQLMITFLTYMPGGEPVHRLISNLDEKAIQSPINDNSFRLHRLQIKLTIYLLNIILFEILFSGWKPLSLYRSEQISPV